MRDAMIPMRAAIVALLLLPEESKHPRPLAYGPADLNKMNAENGPPVKLPAFERPAYLESLAPAPAEK